MKTFKINLTRSYAVTIEAENEKSAMGAAEFFIGDPHDASNEKERKEHSFRILNIEMIMNEAFEVEKVSE